jgi:hypothetical protein
MKLKTVSVHLNLLRTLLEGEETAPLSINIVEQFMQELKSTLNCAPLFVCNDGNDNFLFDGYHRLEAMRRLGFNTCLITIYKGDRRDAYRRYIGDKLKAKEILPKAIIFRHCIGRLKSDLEWSEMDALTLSRLFGRKPEFFQNVQLWQPQTRNPLVLFMRPKHGTSTLTKRFRN